MLANLADNQPQSRELLSATQAPSRIMSIPPRWPGWGPLFTVCLGICLIWQRMDVIGQNLFTSDSIWVFSGRRKEKKEPQNNSRRLYILDEWTIASFPFCFMCIRFHFRFLCVCVLCLLHCMCKLRLRCKDRIIWDSWLACGLSIKCFLLNVRLYAQI